MSEPASCERCGKATPLPELRPVRRAVGCSVWVCECCVSRIYGVADPVGAVAWDRSVYGSGPKVLT